MSTGVASDLDLYASGIPAEVLRTCLAQAASRCWGAYITDIKNAFLLAPIPEGERTRIILKPPSILEQTGVTSPGEVWLVERAVYGLRQSPRWWSDYRDSVLKAASSACADGCLTLQQSKTERNHWSIIAPSGEVLGHIIVYVDGMMILASNETARSAHSWLRGFAVLGLPFGLEPAGFLYHRQCGG